jgi:protein phosphatase PTC7
MLCVMSRVIRVIRLDWPWWMKLANTRLRDGRLQLGELSGGKQDDITVLVAVVCEEDVQLPEPTPLLQSADVEAATPGAAPEQEP